MPPKYLHIEQRVMEHLTLLDFTTRGGKYKIRPGRQIGWLRRCTQSQLVPKLLDSLTPKTHARITTPCPKGTTKSQRWVVVPMHVWYERPSLAAD